MCYYVTAQFTSLKLSNTSKSLKKKRRVLFKYNNCNTDTVVMIQNTEIYKCKSVEPFEFADREGNGSHEH